MANEIQFPDATGLNYYALILSGGQAWNGSAPESFQAAHWSTYALPLTEQGGSGLYLASFPPAPAGAYGVAVYRRAGASPALGDTPVATGRIDWDGAAELSLDALAAPVFTPLDSGTARAGGASTITLAAGATALDLAAHGGCLVVLTQGTGQGQTGQVTAYDATGKVATVTPPWLVVPDATTRYEVYGPQPATAGGGAGSGTGARVVTQDTGGVDNLTYRTAGGTGIGGATVRAYLATEWAASPLTAAVRGEAQTVATGRWAGVMMLDPGTYVFAFQQAGASGVDTEAVTVT